MCLRRRSAEFQFVYLQSNCSRIEHICYFYTRLQSLKTILLYHLPSQKAKALISPGRWSSRHNSRPLPLPARHAQNPPPILRRLHRIRRLHGHLPRRRERHRRLRARRRSLLHNLRLRQAQPLLAHNDAAKRRGQGVHSDWRRWSSDTHAGGESG